MYVEQFYKNNMIIIVVFWRTADEEICLRNILRVFAVDGKDLFVYQADERENCLCLVGRRTLQRDFKPELRPGEIRFPVDHHWGSIYSWRQDVTIASALVFIGDIVDNRLILEKQVVHGYTKDFEQGCLCFNIQRNI